MKNKSRTILAGLIVALIVVGCKSDELFYSNVMKSDVFYQVYSDTSFDFLWVLDNSGSMKPHRDFIRDNMQNFVNILTSRKAVDYQMSVTDTDMFSHNGSLVAGAGGIKVVKSKESKNPIADFASIVNNVVDSPTSFWEQGLEAGYQAVYQYGSQFSRSGVPLVVIMVSDEEDYSCQSNCFGVEPEHNPDWVAFPVSRYKDYFKGKKKAESSYVHFFPIIGQAGHPCSPASYGLRYESVAEGVDEGKSGNIAFSGSICPSELAASYNKIAQIIADRGAVFPLSSHSSGRGINLYVDSVLIPFSPDNYIYDAALNAIVFTGAVPKKGSIIEVTYSEK